MLKIILFMKRTIVADALIERLSHNTELEIICEHNYHKAKTLINEIKPKAILLEASESVEYGIDYCIEFAVKLKEENIDLKLIIMCPEQDKVGIERILLAKEKGLLDDFVFYDASIDYLALKLLLS